jgi:hypothetical protein
MLGMGITRGFDSTSAAGPHAYVSQLGLRNGVGRIEGGAAAAIGEAKADAIFESSKTCFGEMVEVVAGMGTLILSPSLQHASKFGRIVRKIR